MDGMTKLRSVAGAKLLEEFDNKTKKAYSTIKGLSERWREYRLSVSDTFSLRDFYDYLDARRLIFYEAKELAARAGNRDLERHFAHKLSTTDYDYLIYENNCGERIPAVMGVRVKGDEITILLDDRMPGLDD